VMFRDLAEGAQLDGPRVFGRKRSADAGVSLIGPPIGLAQGCKDGRPCRLERAEGESAALVAVEQLESVECGSLEFRPGDRTVEVGIGSRDRLRHVQQRVAGSALEAAGRRVRLTGPTSVSPIA